jgi:hypothetical protein
LGRKEIAMAKQVFISFAVEDKWARDYLAGQAKNDDTPFDFADMSVKEPWDEKWKTNCRIKIKGCDGLIAFVSKNTMKADGARWEMKCAEEEGIPMIGVYTKAEEKGCSIPPELNGSRVIDWKWAGIAAFITSL